ncbi:MAG: hypothetical protein JW954_04475 [Dehalococcoidaceae bacterium]|nr:hypothetical protein [Dehalococcoidaceae bacterium]
MESNRIIKRFAVISIPLIAACLVVFLVPIVIAPDTGQLPGATIEAYCQEEPLSIVVPLEYEVIEAKYLNRFWFAGSDVWVTIGNPDTNSGDFSVEFELFGADGAVKTMTASEYIEAGQAAKVMIYHSGGHIVCFEYAVFPPLKNVIEYREVTRTREVAPDQQDNMVERVTIFEYLARHFG